MEKNNSFKVNTPDEMSEIVKTASDQIYQTRYKLNVLIETFQNLADMDQQPEMDDFGAWAKGICLILRETEKEIIECNDSLWRCPDHIKLYSVDQAKVEEHIEHLKSIGIAEPTSP